MNNNFKDAIKNRRTYYSLSNSSPISDKEIQDIIEYAVMHVPSAFNSQSSRVVLLLGDNHKKLWETTTNILKEIVPENAFKNTKAKIEHSFASGYGTILFFEDQSVVEKLQEQFPAYSDNFPIWSQQTSGMHQWVIWTMLENAGLGASLQHYNPLINEKVTDIWKINPNWKLIAQMPFGTPSAQPGEKDFSPIQERVLVFK